ncbi:MAG: IS66 family transposase [Verrucomicrobiota bacterium]
MIPDREAQLLERIASLEGENALLRQKLDLVLRRMFGAKSEQLDARQLELLLEGTPPGKSPEPVAAEEPRRSKAPSSPREKKPRLPEHLPVIEEVLIPELVKTAPEQWRKIGEEISERLDYEPGRFLRLRTVRPKYVRRGEVGAVPVVAPLPACLLERSPVASGLLAQIVVSKYCDHLPLYRQESIYWNRHQVWLPRQNLADWVLLAADWLRPVYQEIKKGLLARGYLQVDETPIRYLAPGHGKTKLGYLWTSGAPNGGVFFHWETGRGAACLENIIPADFRGVIQCDGYAGCMAHVRRKFHEAREQSPRVAGWILKHIQNLYALEAQLRSTRAGPALRNAMRSSQSQPVLARLHRALIRLKTGRRFLPRSAMGKAIDYALGQWSSLLVFLEEDRLEIGRVENRRGGGRLRELLFPAVFTKVPVPHSHPLLRFLFPLVEPDLQLYRIRLSSPIDKLSLSIGWHVQRAA